MRFLFVIFFLILNYSFAYPIVWKELAEDAY